jgi:hypothetical protein
MHGAKVVGQAALAKMEILVYDAKLGGEMYIMHG